MSFCSKCGVEVDSGIERCPLCGTPMEGAASCESAETIPENPETGEKPRMDDRNRRNLAWQVISILCGIAVVVVAGSDLRAHGALRWSRYPMGSVALAWIISTLAIYLRRRPMLVLALGIAMSGAFLGFLALVSGGLSWYFGLAFPLLVLGMVTTAIDVFVINRLRAQGLNVVAIVSLGLAALAAEVDGVIEHYLSGQVALTWSIIVLQALIPFSGIMLFLHHRLRSRFDFKRIFHT